MNLGSAAQEDGVLIPDRLARRSIDICHEVAERLRSPDEVRAIVCRPDNVWPKMRRGRSLTGRSPWAPGSLSNGYPGIALLHTALAHNEPSLHGAAHDHLAAAIAAAPGTGSAGLFGWHGSIAFVAAVAATATGGYTKLLAKLEPVLERSVQVTIDRQLGRWSAGSRGVSWEAYDVIVGLSGIGRELLLAIDSGRTEYVNTLNRILTFFVMLTEPIDANGHQVPGWWTPPQHYPNNDDKIVFPCGDFNLGLAHGISGPLALLALTLVRGIAVDGQRDAMRRIIDWLLSWRGEDDLGYWWPSRVPWEEQVKPIESRSAQRHPQPSWCYGPPGIARAIQLASRALGDAAIERHAVAALRSVFERPLDAWFSDADLCHGYAGLLQVTWRMATECADTGLAREVPRLVADILARHDSAAPFGFRYMVWADDDQDASYRGRWVPLDVAGALEGAAGVALALLTATGNLPRGSRNRDMWDAALLLS